jgi:drug/metabolite transporter (DMT)-like permease
MKSGSRHLYVYPLMLITTIFWALGHPLGRIVLRSMHPFQLGSINLVVGFLSVLAYLAIARKAGMLFRMPIRDLLSSLALGVIGFSLYQILTFSALSRIPASMNAVLVATNVVFIVPLSALFLRERIGWLRVVGILGAFAGAVVVAFNQGFSLNGSLDLTGCAFSLLAALSFALYTVLGKRLVERNDPLIVATVALFSGAVVLTILTAITPGLGGLLHAGAEPWLLAVLLGVTMIGFAYPTWFSCLKRLPATRVSVFIYLTPVFAVVLSFLILREVFAWPFYLGGALVLGGLIVSSTER